jgi:hypothetical protein
MDLAPSTWVGVSPYRYLGRPGYIDRGVSAVTVPRQRYEAPDWPTEGSTPIGARVE